MSDGLVLIGAGGHARVVLDAARLSGLKIFGVISREPPVAGFPAEYLGGDEQLGVLPRMVRLVMGVGGAGSPALRRSLFERAKALGFNFQTVVHPAAILAADVVLGEGCQIMARAVIQTGTVLGVNVIVNSAAVIDHDGCIGDHVHIAPGTILAGKVSVGVSTLVGTGASVAPNISIGKRSVIGAGAAVVNDIPDDVVAFGVPCRVATSHKP